MTPAAGADLGRLWSRNARTVTVVGQAVGLALGVIGVVGAGRQHTIEHQVVWINVAVLGALVAGCAQAMWLLEGRRSVSLLRRYVTAGLAREDVGGVLAAERAPADHAAAVVVAGGRTHHRPSCVLVQGKPLRPSADDATLRPCGVCGG